MRIRQTCLCAAALCGLMLPALPAAAAPAVVASIKPIHSLVAAVMEGVGTPALLLVGGASPHSYSLTPSDASLLQDAELVFWAGHGLELFLADTLDTLAGGAVVVELADADGLELLPMRHGGAFEPDEDEAGHEDHDAHTHVDDAADMHFWLDPQNAKRLVGAIADALSSADPDNADHYRDNAARETAELDALTSELAAALGPVRATPFIVFHDAYQYFERRFGLTPAGSITISPEVAPGAQRIAALKARVGELGAPCVFAEPQFEPAVISAITEGTGARSGVLDPEGTALPEGPDLYPALLRGLAAELLACLSAAAP